MLHGYLASCGPCPYLPGREFRAFLPQPNPPPGIGYRELMDLRFRRSGDQVYLPMCEGCNACQPIRLRVATFAPRADQRRCATRNRDLIISAHPRGLDEERRSLYLRYQRAVHDRPTPVAPPDDAPAEVDAVAAECDDGDPAASLVLDGGIPGGELHARDAQGRLLAVSCIDVIGDALSSVYCYWEPDQRRRGLGTAMALAEIAHARALGLTWYYLGFHVAGCAKMAYKARFGPCEILVDQQWQPLGVDDTASRH